MSVSLESLLAQSTLKWLKVITKNYQENVENYQDVDRIQKGVWYAQDFLRACRHNNPAIFDNFKEEGWQLTGYAPPQFFDRIPDVKNRLKYREWQFLAKPEVLPSDALKAAIQGLSIIDCGMACQIARYMALLEVLKEDKFNRLFGSVHGQLMNIGYSRVDELQPMRYLTDFAIASYKDEKGEAGNRPVKEGEICAFDGVQEYPDKYPYHHWQSITVLCSNDSAGNQRYVGLGLNPEGETEEEICTRLLDNYNNEEDVSLIAPTKEIKYYEIAKRSFPKKEEKVKGFNSGTPNRFKIEVIQDLMELPLDQVSIDFVKNHPSNKYRF